jgi:hypothetical protein
MNQTRILSPANGGSNKRLEANDGKALKILGNTDVGDIRPNDSGPSPRQ